MLASSSRSSYRAHVSERECLDPNERYWRRPVSFGQKKQEGCVSASEILARLPSDSHGRHCRRPSLGQPKSIAFAAGGTVADGAAVEKTLRSLVDLAKDLPDFPKVQFDAGSIGDVKLHRLLSRHAARLDSLPPDLRDGARTNERGRVLLTPELESAMLEQTVEAVARHFHPDAQAPWAQFSLPEVLLLAERLCRDVRREALRHIPGVRAIRLSHLLWAHRQSDRYGAAARTAWVSACGASPALR